jgi:5'-nucleotidase / UDP-sugar diphosphatase
MNFKTLFGLFLIVTSLHAQKITILHTNDHHGQFIPDTNGDFGLAAQSTLVKSVREEAAQNNSHVLLLSAGDINTGTAESNLFQAKPDIEAMNKMGYTAMAVGNHEFDVGVEELKKQQVMAKFPFLSNNLFNETGENLFPGYQSLQIENKRIAIIGLLTPDTPKESLPERVKGVEFRDPFPITKKLVKELKKDHDVIIVLSHLGFYPNESHGARFPGDLTLAKEIPEIDVIVGGHTHTELTQPVREGKTLIVQAKETGQFVGKLELELVDGKLVMQDYKLLPVKGLIQDPAIVNLFKPYLKESRRLLSKVITTSKVAFEGSRQVVVSVEAPIGNLITESHKKAAQADIAIFNGKGIRAGLPQGEVTSRDIYSVLPFNNRITTVELTADELYEAVQRLHDKFLVQEETVYFSQGFKLEIKNGKVTTLFLN